MVEPEWIIAPLNPQYDYRSQIPCTRPYILTQLNIFHNMLSTPRRLLESTRHSTLRLLDVFRIQRPPSPESHEINNLLHRRSNLPSIPEDEYEDDPDSIFTTSQDDGPEGERDILVLIVNILALGWTIGLYIIYPFPTTIPLFMGLLICITGWTCVSLFRGGMELLRAERKWEVLDGYRSKRGLGLGFMILLIGYWASLGVVPPHRSLDVRIEKGEKFFIAANLYNNEGIFTNWSQELLKLIEYCESSSIS